MRLLYHAHMSGVLSVGTDRKSPVKWVEAHDELLEILAPPDSYANAEWADESLVALKERVAARMNAIRARVEGIVLQHKRASRLEPWMLPIVERELKTAPLFEDLSKVAELIDQAVHDRVALVFFAD